MSKARKTRNANTESEAKYWGGIRSALRKHFQYWKPMAEAKKMARIRILKESLTERQKSYWGKTRFGFVCSHCGHAFKSKEVEIDHLVPVGSLRSLEDLAPFVARLTAEDPNSYQVVCKECHQPQGACLR